MKKVVRFTRGVSLYNAGEIAGFDAEVAQAYVDAGAAEFHDPNARPAASSSGGDGEGEDMLAFQKGADRKPRRGLRT